MVLLIRVCVGRESFEGAVLDDFARTPYPRPDHHGGCTHMDNGCGSEYGAYETQCVYADGRLVKLF